MIEAARINDALFAKAVHGEEKRLGYFVAGKISEIIDKLDALLAAPLEQFEANAGFAALVREEIAHLGEFVRVNNEGVRKILKKYRKVLGRATTWHDPDTWLARSTHTVDQLVIALSQYYAKHFPDTEWAPPSSFERKTTKYWVRMDDILRIKLFIIQHLPILEIHKTPYPSRGLDQTPPTQVHNYISSLYLDNAAFTCYHDRIEKLEGAELLRIRWYGGVCANSEALPSPDPGDVLFMERKEHHESWVEEKSTKLRFPLNQALLSAFMAGTLSAHDAVEFMIHQGAIKQKEAPKLLDVATNFQYAIQHHGLRPVVRTTYHRTAFQLSNNNDARISLDAPMYITPEKPDKASPYSHLGSADPHGDHFPYGVLEIKLSGGASPQWVDELLGLVEIFAVPKFSKYQQGVADNYQQHIRLLPYWLGELKVKTGYDKIGYTDEEHSDVHLTEPKATKGPAREKGHCHADGAAALLAAAPTTLTVPTSAAGTSDSGAASSATSGAGSSASLPLPQPETGTPTTRAARAAESHARAPTAAKETQGIKGALTSLVSGLRRRNAPANTNSTTASLTASPASSDALALAKAPLPTTTTTTTTTATTTATTNNPARSAAAPPPGPGPAGSTTTAIKLTGAPRQVAKVQRPLKIEPKTYFANERTFIQWMSAGVLIFSLSVALMTISPTSRVVGLVLFPVAILFFAYALWLFLWRVNMINSRERKNYFDSFGPWFFSITLSLVAAVSLAVIWSAYAQDPLVPAPNLFCSEAPPVCLSRAAATIVGIPTPSSTLSISEYLFYTSASVLNINQSLGAYNCSVAATAPTRAQTLSQWERTIEHFCTNSTHMYTTASGLRACNWGNNTLFPPNVALSVRRVVELRQLEVVIESTSLATIADIVASASISQASILQVVVQCPDPAYRLFLSISLPRTALLSSTAAFDNLIPGGPLFLPDSTAVVAAWTDYAAYHPYGLTIAGLPVVLAFEPTYHSSLARAALVSPPATVRLSMVLVGSSNTLTQTALQQTARTLASTATGNNYVVNLIDVNAVIAAMVCAVLGFLLLVAFGVKFYPRIRERVLTTHRNTQARWAAAKEAKVLAKETEIERKREEKKREGKKREEKKSKAAGKEGFEVNTDGIAYGMPTTVDAAHAPAASMPIKLAVIDETVAGSDAGAAVKEPAATAMPEAAAVMVLQETAVDHVYVEQRDDFDEPESFREPIRATDALSTAVTAARNDGGSSASAGAGQNARSSKSVFLGLDTIVLVDV